MWRTVILYALGLAVAAAALEQLKFRYAADEISTDVYVGLLALGFTVLGLWVGHRLTAKKSAAAFERNEAAIAALRLTQRECQILDLLASGRSNRELADALGISSNTVKTHLANLFAKLDVDRRVKAIEKARFLALIE